MPSTKSLQPRKQAKQRRAADTRERILEAAAHVFAEYGYAAGTTNRIAERAGVSIGSLYQYFPNKDSILVELVHAHVNAGISIIQRHLSASAMPESLDAQIRLFVRATIENHVDAPALHQVLFEEAPRPAELLKMLHAAEEWIVQAAQHLLAEHPEVAVTDIETAARLVVSAIESLVHRYFAAGQPIELLRFEDELVAMLSRYLHGGSDESGASQRSASGPGQSRAADCP
ncbi:MAG: TetR/AcrR family transcriptional regulator [Acidimicrobiales bacterium]